MAKTCNTCTRYGASAADAAVAPCSHYGFLVVANYDGPRCVWRSVKGAEDAGARSGARTPAPQAPAFPPATNRGGKVQTGQSEEQALDWQTLYPAFQKSAFQGNV